MNSVGLHVFAQLLKVLPMDTFEAIAAKYPLKPCNSRKFTPRDYFTAMFVWTTVRSQFLAGSGSRHGNSWWKDCSHRG